MATKQAVKTQRFDRIDAPYWMVQPFERTDEGYLTGRAVVTNVGVFVYRDAAGNERRELRLPSEVFSGESIASLRLKPVTNDHPDEAVTAQNVREHQVGMTGGNPSTDGWAPEVDEVGNGTAPNGDRYHLSIDMVITDETTIAEVSDGKQALSGGYFCDIEPESGVWMGIPYDVIQRNIRYNHVAIVDRGRAGDAARIALRQDSDDAIMVDRVEQDTDYREDSMSLKKVTIDGVEYEAEADVIKALHDAQGRADTAETTVTEQQAKIDTLEDKVKKLEADIETASDPTRIDSAVTERLRVLDAAKRADVDVTDDMDETAIKRAVVLSVFPNADTEKLDKADSVYLDARFDGAVEEIERAGETAVRNRATVADGIGDVTADDKSSEAARQRMVADQQNAWKRGE